MSVYFHNKKIAPIVKKEVEPEITGYAEVEFPVEINASFAHFEELSDHTLFFIIGNTKNIYVLNREENKWNVIETDSTINVNIFISSNDTVYIHSGNENYVIDFSNNSLIKIERGGSYNWNTARPGYEDSRGYIYFYNQGINTNGLWYYDPSKNILHEVSIDTSNYSAMYIGNFYEDSDNNLYVGTGYSTYDRPGFYGKLDFESDTLQFILEDTNENTNDSSRIRILAENNSFLFVSEQDVGKNLFWVGIINKFNLEYTKLLDNFYLGTLYTDFNGGPRALINRAGVIYSWGVHPDTSIYNIYWFDEETLTFKSMKEITVASKYGADASARCYDAEGLGLCFSNYYTSPIYLQGIWCVKYGEKEIKQLYEGTTSEKQYYPYQKINNFILVGNGSSYKTLIYNQNEDKFIELRDTDNNQIYIYYPQLDDNYTNESLCLIHDRSSNVRILNNDLKASKSLGVLNGYLKGVDYNNVSYICGSNNFGNSNSKILKVNSDATFELINLNWGYYLPYIIDNNLYFYTNSLTPYAKLDNSNNIIFDNGYAFATKFGKTISYTNDGSSNTYAFTALSQSNRFKLLKNRYEVKSISGFGSYSLKTALVSYDWKYLLYLKDEEIPDDN